MTQTAENILREYIQFDDVNQSETIELLPLTIIDAMEEYAKQQQGYSKEEVIDILQIFLYNSQRGEDLEDVIKWFKTI